MAHRDVNKGELKYKILVSGYLILDVQSKDERGQPWKV